MKRWLIRTFCLLLFLLCGAGWRASYTYSFAVAYLTKYQNLGVELNSGSLIIRWWKSNEAVTFGVHFEKDAPQTDKLLEIYPHILGFYGRIDTTFPDEPFWLIGVPFWFLTLLATAILFYIWRKTRPKPNPATAFPVEMGKLKS